MELAISILLSIVALICFAGGINLLLKGAYPFLPESILPQRILDNLVRFLSGIYFGFSFLLAWAVFQVHQQNELIYFLGIIVAFSGLGRLYSRVKVGSAGKYFDFVMVLEIALGAAIVLLQYFR